MVRFGLRIDGKEVSHLTWPECPAKGDEIVVLDVTPPGTYRVVLRTWVEGEPTLDLVPADREDPAADRRRPAR